MGMGIKVSPLRDTFSIKGETFICISYGTHGTEIDEQEIENLLNDHSDSEYECQNDNEF